MAAPRQPGFRARFAGRELQPGSERDFALGFLTQVAQPMGMGPAGAAPMGGPGMGRADYSRGPLTLGLSVGRTLGLGGYSGPSGGRMSTSMTGFLPVGGLPGQRQGLGVGGDRLRHRRAERDAGRRLGARDGRVDGDDGGGDAGRADRLAGTGAFPLAFKADALWVGAASDLLDGAAGRLNASEARVTRVRTALEGSRGFTLGGRLSLTPSVEVGLRRDGGDTETGAGMDVGGGLAFKRQGHGAVARRAGADAGGAPGRRVHRPRDVAVAGVEPRRRRARWG